MSQGPGLPSRLSSTEQMVVSARVASRRAVAAARGVWDYLSSPALERCCLLRGSKRQALVRP